jgi:DNA-binding NtrC family response regulator
LPKNDDDDAGLAETLRPGYGFGVSKLIAEATITGLGIIWHNDHHRIGEIAPLHFDRSGTVQLSRMTPNFAGNREHDERPLLDQHLSRSSVLIQKIDNRQFLFTPPDKKIEVRVNGQDLVAPKTFHIDEFGNEIIIFLSNSVVLSLFNAPARRIDEAAAKQFGMLGISEAIVATKRAISRLSKGNLPVLIRGETGTGKELVATGLHEAGDRVQHAMIAVNMATLTPSLAAAELFGVKKGAYTGAERDKAGLFEQADGGVLFLDEIGDTPNEVQPMLLRVIENGEFRRVGDDKVRKANVRVFAATDRSLELDVRGQVFNQPLRRRLEAISISVPPLRDRRCDLGILLRSFLQEQSNDMPRFDLTDLSAADVHTLALYPWPGNVRELRNLAQQLRYGQPLLIAAFSADTAPSLVLDAPRYDNPNKISEADLLGALDENNWVIKATAQSLNLSRTSLYERMKKSAAIRSIDDIRTDELERVLHEVPGGLNAWAKHLRVTRESLARRLRGLRLTS